MKDAKIFIVPCRSDMPLTEKVQNGLSQQFRGLVEVVPPPDVPETPSNLLSRLGDRLQVPGRPLVILIDLTCLRTRPGFVRTLLVSPEAEEAVVVAADQQCERLLQQILSRKMCDQIVRAGNPRGFVSLLLQRLERCPYPAVGRGLRAEYGLGGIVGESQFIVELRQRLPLIAGSDASVLITGETGTGKEVVAHAIHYLSERRRKPFVALHCGAVPSDLFENELFGHKSGAYTGAQGQQQGLIGQAHQGTLFLDEISTLPLSDQAKLLRVLQDGEYRPLGGGAQTRADVHVVAASNTDLEFAVEQNGFRRDLLYRINAVLIDIPPLRQRPEDILPLAEHFLRLYCRRDGKEIEGFSPVALVRLKGYDWPGNVRELQHVVECAVLFAKGPEIEGVMIPHSATEENNTSHTYRAAKRQAMEKFERGFLTQALQKAGGNISKASRWVGVDRSSFVALLRRYKIDHGELKEE